MAPRAASQPLPLTRHAAIRLAIVLLAAIALLGGWSMLGLTSDGAHHLAMILDRQGYTLWDPPRLFAFLLIQSPIVVLEAIGVSDRDTMFMAYSLMVIGLPLAAIAIAAWLARADDAVLLLVAVIAIAVTVPMLTYAVSETNLLVGLALIVVAVALRRGTSWRGELCALVAAVLLMRVHEGGAILIGAACLAVLASLLRAPASSRQPAHLPRAVRRWRWATAVVLLLAMLLCLRDAVFVEVNTAWRQGVRSSLLAELMALRYSRFVMCLLAATLVAACPAPGRLASAVKALAFAVFALLAIHHGFVVPGWRVQLSYRLFALVGVPVLIVAAVLARHALPRLWAAMGPGIRSPCLGLAALISLAWLGHTALLWHDYLQQFSRAINTATADLAPEGSPFVTVPPHGRPLHEFRPQWALRPLAVLVRYSSTPQQWYLALHPDEAFPFPLADRNPYPGVAAFPRPPR